MTNSNSNNQFKTLKNKLNKFQNEKYKANSLRLNLLAFLRLNDYSYLSDTSPSTIISNLNILLNWCNLLVSQLSNSNSLDKSCYLECISRIISRYEWFLADSVQLKQKYIDTLHYLLNYSFNNLLHKKKLSYNVFIGKLISYSIFHIDLNFETSHNTLEFNSILEKPTEYFLSDDQLNQLFPAVSAYKHHNNYSNWNNYNWTKETDILNSFMKHYFSIVSTLLAPLISDADNTQVAQLLIFKVPLFNNVLSSLFGKLENYINLSTSTYSTLNLNSSSNSNSTFPNYTPISHKTSIKTLLKTIPLLRGSKLSFPILQLLNYFLSQIACSIELLNYDKCIGLIDVYYEVICEFSDIINWKFLINICFIMLSVENYSVQLKVISFFFNIWTYIPDYVSTVDFQDTNSNGIKDNFNNWYKGSLKKDLSIYLVSTLWNEFFGNHQPIIRQYYMRLVAWRIYSFSQLSKQTICNNLHGVYQLLNESEQKIDYTPSSIVLNKKIIISANDNFQVIKKDEFDIYDDYIYIMDEPTPQETKRWMNFLLRKKKKLVLKKSSSNLSLNFKKSFSFSSLNLGSRSESDLSELSSLHSMGTLSSAVTNITNITNITSDFEVGKKPSKFKFQIINDSMAVKRQSDIINFKNQFINDAAEIDMETIMGGELSKLTYPKFPKNYQELYNATSSASASASVSSSASSLNLNFVPNFKPNLDVKLALNFAKSLSEWNIIIVEFNCFFEKNMNYKNFDKADELIPSLNSDFTNQHKSLNDS